VLGLKLDVSLFKTFEGFLDDTDSSFNNELSGVDLGLGLLDLQETLGNFSMVSDLHKIHALDLNSGNHASGLEHLFQVLGDDRGIIKETGFIGIVRSVGELGADTTEDIVSLVGDEVVEVDYMVKGFHGLVDGVSNDGRAVHGGSTGIGDGRALDVDGLYFKRLGVSGRQHGVEPMETWLFLYLDNLAES
jgi:hypothetical protein